jgi:hypothetical protein
MKLPSAQRDDGRCISKIMTFGWPAGLRTRVLLAATSLQYVSTNKTGRVRANRERNCCGRCQTPSQLRWQKAMIGEGEADSVRAL